MSFPADVKERALIACARRCCLCEEHKALKIELHHIVQKSEGGQDTFDNCIPLCFDCHADMRSIDHKHPKGTKYTPTELKARRDNWYRRVASGESTAPTSADFALSRAEIPSEQSADVPLYDAFWRAYLRTWDKPPHDPNIMAVAEPSPGYWDAFYSLVQTDIRQAAFDGRLPIWGRRGGNWVLATINPPVRERIPREFWQHNWLDILEIAHHDPNKLATVADPLCTGEEKWRDLSTNREAVERIWPSLNQGPLRLAVGETSRFFETTRAGSFYTHKRILKVRISNGSPAKALTGCKVYVMDIAPHEYDGPWLLKEGISLAAGDYEFVPLARYTEPDNIKLSPYGDTFMEILAAKNQPLPPSGVQHVLTIRATTLDGPFCEIKCRIWVDESGRLRIEAIR